MNSRPFTRRVVELRRRGLRYADLEAGCARARSTAWFNNLVNKRVWSVGPPPDNTLEDLAELLGTTERHVAEMIAEEWYGVRVTEQSSRVRSLAPRIDALSEPDLELVEALVQRLQPPVAESGHASAA